MQGISEVTPPIPHPPISSHLHRPSVATKMQKSVQSCREFSSTQSGNFSFFSPVIFFSDSLSHSCLSILICRSSIGPTGILNGSFVSGVNHISGENGLTYYAYCATPTIGKSGCHYIFVNTELRLKKACRTCLALAEEKGKSIYQ